MIRLEKHDEIVEAMVDRIKRKSTGVKRSKYRWPKRKFGQ